MRKLLLVLAIPLVAGCASTARLIPLAGPYSEITPQPVIQARFTGARNDGDIAFTLPDGPTCEGKWKSDFSFYGQTPARATASCSDGRTVDFDLSLSSVGRKSGSGTGKDTKGNVYRFML